MGLVLDTSIFVAIERKTIALDLSEINQQKYISPITISELLFGLYKSNNNERKLKREFFIEDTIMSIPSIPFGNKEAKVYSLIYYELKSNGINIGYPDLIIGATAIAHNCKVLTMNQRDFKRIPGLEMENIEEYLVPTICYS